MRHATHPGGVFLTEKRASGGRYDAHLMCMMSSVGVNYTERQNHSADATLYQYTEYYQVLFVAKNN